MPSILTCSFYDSSARGYIVDIDGITVVIIVAGFINVGYNSYLAKSCMEKLARDLGLKNGSPEFDMREAVEVVESE
jgi:hypothetical protein